MELGLLVFITILANLVLYWIFFGKKKFDQKFQQPVQSEEVNNGRKKINH